jgi:hypothetical protein
VITLLSGNENLDPIDFRIGGFFGGLGFAAQQADDDQDHRSAEEDRTGDEE